MSRTPVDFAAPGGPGPSEDERIAAIRSINRTDEGREAARALLSLNGRATNSFVEQLSQAHPTEQQAAMRNVLAFIEAMAKKKGGAVDGRNEASVKLARKIMNLTLDKDRALPRV